MEDVRGVTKLIHATADVSSTAVIGEGSRVWHHCHIREGVIIGRNCVLGKGVYIDADVRIGDNVKIQNNAAVYRGVALEDGVFCGPHVVLTNDRHPRAIKPDGSPKGPGDWTVGKTLVRSGASIGAHVTVVSGVTIGRWAMIGAGSVVTRDVPDYGLAFGNPARLRGFSCPCGHQLRPAEEVHENLPLVVRMQCAKCHSEIFIPSRDYALLSLGR